MRNNKIKYVWENRTLLIYIVSIIIILYSGYKQILLLGAGLEFLTLPITWYVTVINLIFFILGIGIIRLKKYGWFGGSSLFLILLFINLFVVLSYFIYVLFNKSLVESFPAIKNIAPTRTVLNSKLLF